MASSVGMDKVYTKIIFDKAGINQAKYVYIRKYNDKFIYVKENFDEQTAGQITTLAEEIYELI